MVHDPADQPEMPTGGFSDPGLDESELRARRALGLGRGDAPKTRAWPNSEPGRRQSGATHHKSRFVQDGEVPVVLVSNRPGRSEAAASPTGNERSRLADADAALRRERAAREQVERDLVVAQNQVRDLQTRLAHAELARDEAQAGERAALERVAALERLEATVGPEDEAGADEGEELASTRPRRGRPRKPDADAPVRRVTRARIEAAAEGGSQGPEALPSDKPVKWWLQPGEDDDEDE